MGTMLRAMWRRPAGPLLLLLEVAVGMTVMLQSANLVAPVIEETQAWPGFSLEGLWAVTRTAVDGGDLPDGEARLAATAGVEVAARVDLPPFALRPLWTRLRTDAGGEGRPTWVLAGSPGLGGVLGLRLVAGRALGPDDAGATPAPVVVTEALVAHLFPGTSPADAVGRALEDGLRREPLRVVGVVERLRITVPFQADRDEVLLRATAPADPGERRYLVRAAPGADVREAVRAALGVGDRAVLEIEAVEDQKRALEVVLRTTAWAVLAIAALVVLVVQVGVFAMARLVVASRSRHIGVRRALGATRGDILRYLLFENWVLMTGGIVAGLVLTALTRDVLWPMPLPFALAPSRVVPAVLLFWIAGLAATLGPALRAARISPLEVTRGR